MGARSSPPTSDAWRGRMDLKLKVYSHARRGRPVPRCAPAHGGDSSSALAVNSVRRAAGLKHRQISSRTGTYACTPPRNTKNRTLGAVRRYRSVLPLAAEGINPRRASAKLRRPPTVTNVSSPAGRQRQAWRQYIIVGQPGSRVWPKAPASGTPRGRRDGIARRDRSSSASASATPTDAPMPSPWTRRPRRGGRCRRTAVSRRWVSSPEPPGSCQGGQMPGTG